MVKQYLIKAKSNLGLSSAESNDGSIDSIDSIDLGSNGTVEGFEELFDDLSEEESSANDEEASSSSDEETNSDPEEELFPYELCQGKFICDLSVTYKSESEIPVPVQYSLKFFAIKIRKNLPAAAHDKYVSLFNSISEHAVLG